MTFQAKMKSTSCPSRRLTSSFVLDMKDKCLRIDRLAALLLASLIVASIFSAVLQFSSNPFKFLPEREPKQQKVPSLFQTQQDDEERHCDLFQGRWVRDLNGSSSQYTSSSCSTIPEWKNCFLHGRKDTDFLKWSWKPEGCELPSFDPKAFLEMVRGKTLAFVGDSLARNHMDSLLCLLSKEEVAVDAYKDSEDNNRIWQFPTYNFTLKNLWTRFLVVGQERVVNSSAAGIFDLHLDKLDKNWTEHLPTSDIIVISTGHWFQRPIYLHIGSNIIACVYCNEPNITDRGVQFALRMAVRSALSRINRCKNCKSLVTLLRTFSPAHFENGFWNTGGTCNRTSPVGEGEINILGSSDWELRSFQVEEIGRAMKEKRKEGIKYGVLDITKAMLLRPDGHLGNHYQNRWMKGYNDCLHWCLPGPIDVWNDFLLALLRRLS